MDTKQNLNPTFSLIKGQLGYLQVYKVCLKIGPSQGSERRTLSYSFAVWWGEGLAENFWQARCLSTAPMGMGWAKSSMRSLKAVGSGGRGKASPVAMKVQGFYQTRRALLQNGV